MKTQILIVCLVLSKTILSQNNDEVKYIPKSNMSKDKNENNQSSDDNFKKNYVIFETSLLSRGIAAISYERLFGNRLTLGAGIGQSISKDIIGLLMSGIVKTSGEQFGYEYLMQETTSFTSGKVFMNGIMKYLFGEDEDKIPYIGIDYRKWGYSCQIKDSYLSSYNYFVPDDLNINFDFSSITIKTGDRLLLRGEKAKFFIDIYCGLGIKFTKYDKFVESGQIEDPNNPGSYINRYNKTTETFRSMILQMGLNAGISF
ncbi:MAG: hypothetical protein OHK0036_02910 [Bacteroidia bacterium]